MTTGPQGVREAQSICPDDRTSRNRVPRFESIDWHEHPELYAAAFAEEIRRKADYIKAVQGPSADDFLNQHLKLDQSSRTLPEEPATPPSSISAKRRLDSLRDDQDGE